MPRPKCGTSSRRVYEPGKKHFELIASVSRSSGLEKDGDALRNLQTQEDYRKFIQGKINEYWETFPYGRVPEDLKKREEMQSNVLILLRKLREGLLSTKRKDTFALEVYETSLFLSALFATPIQATSVIPQLLPGMYTSTTSIPPSSLSVVLVSLVHFLVAGYPSQSRFLEHLESLPHTLLPKLSPARRWIWELAWAIRHRNFARLGHLMNRDAFAPLAPNTRSDKDLSSTPTDAPQNLALAALCALVDRLQSKVRGTTWSVLRSAYRELSCAHDANETVSATMTWLCRSLVLRSISIAETQDESTLVDAWLKVKFKVGEVRPKEGVEGRWIVCKVVKS